MTPSTDTFRSRLRSLGHNKDFRLLWIGQAASELGSSVAGLALPLLVLALTGSQLAAGTVGTAAYLAMWLAQLPSGYLADMTDRRRTMLICDTLRAGLSTLLTVLAVIGVLPVSILLIVITASTVLWICFGAAFGQAFRQIVPPDEIPEAVSITQARTYAVNIIGPALSGWLFSLGRVIPLVVDTVSFLVSVCCVWRIRTPLPAGNRPTARRLVPDIGQGWSALWRYPFLRARAAYATVRNIATAALVYTVILGDLGNGAIIGATLSMAAITGLLGSLLSPTLQRRFPLRILMIVLEAATGASLTVAGLTGQSTLLAAALAITSLLSPAVTSALTTAELLLIPDEIRGRAHASISFLASALLPTAPLLTGLLLQYLTPTTVYLTIATGFAITTAIAATAPGLTVIKPLS